MWGDGREESPRKHAYLDMQLNVESFEQQLLHASP